jgi:hypothetical protein
MLPSMSRISLPPLIVILALAGYRVAFDAVAPPAIAYPRTQPNLVAPLYNWPAAVTDEQLAAVLERVQPPTAMPLTNNLVHALRLWGPQAEFGNPQKPSGREMLRYLLDDAEFQRWAGPNAAPLWSRDAEGIRPRNYEDDFRHSLTASYHADDLLATLAESNVSLDEPMILREVEPATVRDVLDHALKTFYLKRFEYEWTMIAYARYAYPLAAWENKYGERMDPAALVQEMIDHPLDVGPCNGLHRLEAMVLLYRVDEATQQLPPRLKQRMLAHMLRVSRLLQASQSTEGYWTRSWPTAKTPAQNVPATLNDKILVTGHQLEWLALAPEEVLPPRENIVRACQWLARTLPEMDAKSVEEYYGPLSHAARALCLWRAEEPYAVWQRMRRTTTSETHAD